MIACIFAGWRRIQARATAVLETFSRSAISARTAFSSGKSGLSTKVPWKNPNCRGDHAWMEQIDASDGAVFFAAGVFYYFKTEDVRRLVSAMAERFPGAVLVFDTCNERGAKLMRKTWLREAGITDVGAYFSLEDESELHGWSEHFASVSARSYMRGYRDIYKDVNWFYRLMIRFCDTLVRMKIVKIVFAG